MNIPNNWTPEADKDRQWSGIAALLRESDEPELPGEARWREMRAHVWREVGIGESAPLAAAPVVPIGEESLARPRFGARLWQVAAVGVLAFALGWMLSPAPSSPEEPLHLAAPMDTNEPDKIVVANGSLPGRVVPITNPDGAPIPVSTNGGAPTGPRVVIREGGASVPAPLAETEPVLLPEFLRTLRAQSGQTISPDAVLESIDALLRDTRAPRAEAALRYLKAETLLLEKQQPALAVPEYEAILRLANNEGALAENARSRLASLRD